MVMDVPGVVTGERQRPDDSTTTTTAPHPAGRLWSWLRPRRRWCLGTRLVIVATVGWLTFVALHLTLSGRTPLWAPVDLIPPLAFVAVPLVLLVAAPFARPVRWRLIAVLLIAGLLGAGRSGVNPATLWHDPPPAPPGAITVVSWNPEFWDQNWRTGDGTSVDLDFYEYLRALDADVYLLKEYLHAKRGIGVGDWTADLAIRIDELPRLRAEFPDYQVAIAGEQITLSRLPIVAQRGLDLRPWLPPEHREIPSDLDDFPDSYRFETLRTDIEVGGTVVTFYNTHIHHPPLDWRLHRSDARGANRYHHERRQASYRALREDAAANPHPFVIGADLNTTPAMGVMRLLPEGIVDPTPALSSLYPTTWGMGGWHLWRIDWMFTTPELTVHRYELPDVADLSDHLPQRMVLSVSG